MDTTLRDPATAASDRLACLEALERKALWLATWMIHNANHLRPKRDGLKVGGHQASCASVTTLMTALYLDAARPEDRIAVKPHAGPVFHAMQYLLGHLERDKLATLRAFGGLQSYPSRTKDPDDVDFSTGSVGLGVAMTLFAALTRDYLAAKRLAAPGAADRAHDRAGRRCRARRGQRLRGAARRAGSTTSRNCWWIIDYNRQSLDSVVTDRLFGRIDLLFESMGWRVVPLKYGKKLEAAFEGPGGGALRDWIDNCPNALYSALTFKGGAGWREHLKRDIGTASGVRALLDAHDDAALARADDQPRRARHGSRCPRPSTPPTGPSRPASSPTRSRAAACPSPATRTTMPG